MRTLSLSVGALLLASPVLRAQSPNTAAAIAVADSALAAIRAGDVVALTDLMIPEALMLPTSSRDGVARYAVRTRAQQREQRFNGVITERGFRPEAKVNGTVAIVWMPYDLYVDDKWSHCGADVFTLVRVGTSWRIATLAWSTEQPPSCEKHPDGPPAGATSP